MSFEQFDFSEEPSTARINVLVCDNESLFREILVATLDKQEILNIIGSASSVTEAIEISRETKPDVVLMDIELGEGPNGITTANEIKDMFPDVGVVVLSAHRDKEFLACRQHCCTLRKQPRSPNLGQHSIEAARVYALGVLI